MRDGKWEYTIRAYRPHHQGGDLAIETVHIGETSRDMEIDAFKRRMGRGEIGHIEVIAHIEPFGVTKIYPDRMGCND